MSHLRKEYKEYKQFKEDMFKEAAELWTEENVILLNERLNRNAIYRLNSAIQRFDSKFGKYREKLPAIAEILDDAENGLQLVITGKVGSRTTAHMLQRLSIMYNILSNFFGGDLGALLKTPAFRKANEQPDEKIDKIIDGGHDLKSIRRNLAAALKPNDQERIIFRKAYKSFEMPTLDWNLAAKQLCCLSCNELKDLAGIEKVPMVVADLEPENNNLDIGIDEQGIGDRVKSAVETAGKVGTTGAGIAVGTAIGAGVGALANRFKSRSKEMTAAITKLEQYVSGVEGFDKVEIALKSLRDKSKSAANSTFDLSGGMRGLLRHPSVVLMKQAVMASEAIESVLKAWNEHIKDTYKDGIKPEDLPKLRKELDKTIKGGVLSRIKGAITGVKPFPGLSPDDIINAVMKVAEKGVVEQEGAKTPAATPPSGASTAGATGATESVIVESFNRRNQTLFELHQMVSEMMLTENYKDLEKLITQLGTFEKSKEGNAETAVEKDLQTAAKTATTTTQPAATQQQGKAAPAQTGAGEPTNVKPPATTQETGPAAQQLAQEAEATAQQDPEADAPDIETLKASVETIKKFANNPLNIDFVDKINKLIPNYKIPNVNTIDDALKFVNTYESVLTNQSNIKEIIGTIIHTVDNQPGVFQPSPKPQPAQPAVAPAAKPPPLPRPAPKTAVPSNDAGKVIPGESPQQHEARLRAEQEEYMSSRLAESKNKKINDRRQLLVEKLKKIILEQLNETQASPEITKKLIDLWMQNPAARESAIKLQQATAAINSGRYIQVSAKLFNTIKKQGDAILASRMKNYNIETPSARPADGYGGAPAAAPAVAAPAVAAVAAPTPAAPAVVAPEVAVDPDRINDLRAIDNIQIKRPVNFPIIDSNRMQKFDRYADILIKTTNPALQKVRTVIDAEIESKKFNGAPDLRSFTAMTDKYSVFITNAPQIRKLFSLINKTANVISKPKSQATASPATPAQQPTAATR